MRGTARPGRRRTLGAATALVAIAIVFAAPRAQATSASPNGHVWTWGGNANLRVTPDTSHPPASWMQNGTPVFIVCTAMGEREMGPYGQPTAIWDRIGDATWGDFISDAFVNTGTMAAVAPACDPRTLAAPVTATADEVCSSGGASFRLTTGNWGQRVGGSTCPTLRQSAGLASWSVTYTAPRSVAHCAAWMPADTATAGRPRIHATVVTGTGAIAWSGWLSYRSDPLEPSLPPFGSLPTVAVTANHIAIAFDNAAAGSSARLWSNSVYFLCR